MESLIDKNIGQIVADDYRTAKVFKKHNIDFCCRGNRNIREIAEKNDLDSQLLIQELEALANTENCGTGVDFKSWAPDLLADYIEKKHHRYVEESIPVLKQYLSKLCRVHGKRHPELLEISNSFDLSARELTLHMKKEELILFPFVRKMVNAKQQHETPGLPRFGTVQNPIQTMKHEHDQEGERFRRIEALSHGYTPPTDACATYRVTYSLLQEFENDLHQHIHLENNILFPKAEALERELGVAG